MKNATHAKRLIAEQRMAVLSTISKRYSGFPFGSVVGYAIDTDSRPLMLVSALAVHHRNLEADARAKLDHFRRCEAMGDPASAARVTVMGEVRPVPEPDLAAARTAYLAKHPDARQWISFGDFTMLRMEIKDLFFIGGFGSSMGWILPLEDFVKAGL